jgi:hypothetical protein
MNSDRPVPHATGVLPYLNVIARVSPWLLVAICVAVVLVFFSLAPYAHPSTDDLCMAVGIRDEGLIQHLWNHYFEWSGRYTGNTFYGVYPLIFGMFDGYWFVPVFMVTSLFAASAFLLSSVFGSKMLDRRVLLSALCFVCVYLLGMISPASGLYWMAGALSYQPANVLLLVALGLMLRLRQRQKRAENISMPFIVLLADMALAVGCNETSMLALAGVSTLFLLLHLRSGRSIAWPWAVVFVLTLVCFGIVYFSPGNAIRAAAFPLRHDLPRSLAGSLDVGLRILGIWLSNPVLLAATLLAPFAISRLYRSSGRTFAVTKTRIVVTGLCTLAIPVVFQFPAWWAMGGWAPARTIDATYFVFLLCWFRTAGAITVYFQREARTRQTTPYAVVGLLAASVLFTLAVLGSGSYRLARSDLAERAGPWDDYMQQRYALIRDAVADGRLSLVVPDYDKPYPRTIYFNDIMYDSRDWRNGCYAAYFGLDRIKRAKRQAE